MMPNPREAAAAQIPGQGDCAGRKRDNRRGTVYPWSDHSVASVGAAPVHLKLLPDT
jgi:hypothetical protein